MFIIKSIRNKNMSDRSVKKSEAAGRKKGSSSGNSKPNMHSIENSEPSSNPITLSTLAISLDTDKKIKTAPKAVLPEAVAQSTSVSNRKSMSTQNTLTEVANGKEYTKESDYHRRTVNTPRFISEPRAAIKKWVSPLLGENKAKSQSITSATTESLNNSEPSALPALLKSSKPNKSMDIGTKALVPGAVADTAVPDKGFKGNKYQRKIAESNVNSRATGYKKSSKESASNEVSSSLSGTCVNNEVVASTFTSLENSEPSAFPNAISAYHSSNPSKGLPGGVASTFTSLESSEPSAFPDFLPDFIAGSRTSNTSDAQRSSDSEANVASPESQDNARCTSQENSIATDTQGLVVATLVESNRNILGTDVIVDAIPVDDNPTTWYKDLRILLIIGIFVIAIAISVFITILLVGGRKTPVESLAPSLFESSKPTRTPSQSPSSSHSTMPSEAPTFSLSPRILKALYDSTDGANWFRRWDFSSQISYCDFYGITCDDSEQITLITLQSNGLRGSLPSELGMLPSLRHLILTFNSINGTIPSEMGLLSLTWLYLDFNSITGTIPTEMGTLSSLTNLELENNLIMGTIPSKIGMLSSLNLLDLRDNSITGTIPSEIGMLPSLTWLYLRANSIMGTIPSEVGLILSLGVFRLDINDITGTIPTELCALTNTQIYYDEHEISCACIGSIYIQGTPCN